MPCPLGSIMNPETGKCILAHGDVAKDLIKRGVIYLDQDPSVIQRMYYPRQPRPPAPVPSQYGYPRPPVPSQYGYPRPPVPQLPQRFLQPCELGKERNPETGKCRKIQRKTVKKPLTPAQAQAQAPAPVPRPIQIPKQRQPSGTTGKATVAPFLDRDSILRWSFNNCKNTIDPVTKKPFAAQQNLTDMIRLHTGTCTLASGLHSKVSAEHKAGRIATIPGDPQTHLIIDDFNVLRDAMRRTNPAYRIPGHKHTPPPPEWRLYIASDNFSGPDFVSIVFLDITKGKHTPTGIQYPIDSIRINMGFLPIHVPNASCSLDVLIERIKQVQIAGKLLVPVAGGWKPIAGFPFKKEDWKHNASAKMNKLCEELTKALSSFF